MPQVSDSLVAPRGGRNGFIAKCLKGKVSQAKTAQLLGISRQRVQQLVTRMRKCKSR
jgi:hypothetical protein